MSTPGRGAAPRHEADVRTAAAAGPSAASPVQVGQYCGHCGHSLADGDHAGCSASLALEPPRFCAACRRRMMVQVVPLGWTARCSRHGEATSCA